MGSAELREWLDSIPDTSSIAVDDGGLTLVEIDATGNLTGAYCEIGGIPLPDPGPKKCCTGT